MFGWKNDSGSEPLTVEYSDDGRGLRIHLAGKLDAVTSPEFLSDARARCGGSDIVLDLDGLDYISSAGLRAILSLDKTMGKGFSLTIVNARGAVWDVLDMSGFSDFFDVRPRAAL